LDDRTFLKKSQSAETKLNFLNNKDEEVYVARTFGGVEELFKMSDLSTA
jgi:hypothetical protein